MNGEFTLFDWLMERSRPAKYPLGGKTMKMRGGATS